MSAVLEMPRAIEDFLVMSDEEIAIGTCFLRVSDYLGTGRQFYSVAEACQDRYLDLLMAQSLDQHEPIASQPQPWQTV